MLELMLRPLNSGSRAMHGASAIACVRLGKEGRHVSSNTLHEACSR
jgi:hypothetical protein